MTDTQSRYAVIELEALGIAYALKKCQFYLKGAPEFVVVSDHKPLLGIWDKDLGDITNPRLQRIRMKTLGFNFRIEWREGKTHYIADALSRYPVFNPEASDDEIENAHTYICRKIQDFTPCTTLIDTITTDRKYNLITDALQNPAFDIGEDHSHPAFEFRKQWDRMSILLSGETKIAVVDGLRILVPIAARSSIIDLLHEGHPGLVRMQKRGSELYFWPDMIRDIETRVKNCQECNLLKASKPKHHMSPESALSPMSHVGVDLFSEKGSTYLVCACRYSGYFFVDQLRSLTTKAVLTKLCKWFLTFGFPLVIRSDGGPQFRSQFSTFCQERNIKHELSSAYNPTSNSLAESTVKQAKHLLKKVGSFGQQYHQELAALLNTPRADGYSPNMLMFGRRHKEQFLPVAPQALCISEGTRKAGLEARTKERQRGVEYKNGSQVPREPFHLGQSVFVQDPQTLLWDSEAAIVEVRDSAKSYLICDSSTGKYSIRSVDHLRVSPTSRLRQQPDTEADTSTWDSSTLPMTTQQGTNGFRTGLRTTLTTSSSTSEAARRTWSSVPSSSSWPSGSAGTCSMTKSRPNTGTHTHTGGQSSTNICSTGVRSRRPWQPHRLILLPPPARKTVGQ